MEAEINLTSESVYGNMISWIFALKHDILLFFYGEGLLAPSSTPKLEGHPFSFLQG
jgi:hypothetical protein